MVHVVCPGKLRSIEKPLEKNALKKNTIQKHAGKNTIYGTSKIL